MEKAYTQLTLEERIEIYRLHAGGISLRKIALVLGRTAGTISRELRRNSQNTKTWKDGYAPVRAEALKERRRRRGRGHKLTLQPELQAYVKEKLILGWSPEQIAGRLQQEHGKPVISHEAIYRFIYHRYAQKDYWHTLLPRKSARRGDKARKRIKAAKIKNRVSIHERPDTINRRTQPGHWEADLMMFRAPHHVLLVACERTSRMITLARQTGKAADTTLHNLNALFADMPQQARQSITFDNGSEFTHHTTLTQTLNIQTFFCDPHKPWQKGSVENSIGRLRRFLPTKTNLEALSNLQLNDLLTRYNNTPRKCLNFLTPNEANDYINPTVALQT